MNFTGHSIAAMRKMLGWTRPEFGNLLGASESAVRRWETRAEGEVPLEARFEDFMLLLREELHRDADRVRDVLHEHRRDGMRALFYLLSLRYGPGYDLPLPRLDSPVA